MTVEWSDVVRDIIAEMAADFVVRDAWTEYEEFADAVIARLEIKATRPDVDDYVFPAGIYYRIVAVEKARAAAAIDASVGRD